MKTFKTFIVEMGHYLTGFHRRDDEVTTTMPSSGGGTKHLSSYLTASKSK